MIRNFGAGDLKKLAPSLGQFQKHILVPMLDIIINKFINYLKKNSTMYSIKKIRIFQSKDPCHMNYKRVQVEMQDGNVQIMINDLNIYVVNGVGPLYMSARISFPPCGPEALSKRLYEEFLNSVRHLDLQELRREAADKLRRGRINSFIPGIAEFYRLK